MSEGRSLWLEVIPASQVEQDTAFDRRFDELCLPTWEGVAVLSRRADGALLMVLQVEPDERPTWALPGGGIEPGETPRQAAVRETCEETGLGIQRLQPHLKVRGLYARSDNRFSYHIYYFVAEVIDGLLSPADPDGAIQLAAWVEPDHVRALQFSHEDQRQMVLRYLGV